MCTNNFRKKRNPKIFHYRDNFFIFKEDTNAESETITTNAQTTIQKESKIVETDKL